MIHYNDTFLRKLEKEILFAYDCSCGVFEDYTHHGCLLELRKNILNEQALTRKNQEELLPYIVAFNDALHDALKYLYDRAHENYTQQSVLYSLGLNWKPNVSWQISILLFIRFKMIADKNYGRL